MTEDWADWRRRCLHFHDFYIPIFEFQNWHLLHYTASSRGRATGCCSMSSSVLFCVINGLQSRLFPLHTVLWNLWLTFRKAVLALQQNCSSALTSVLLSSKRKGKKCSSVALFYQRTVKTCQRFFKQMSFQLTVYVFNLAHMVIHGQVRRAYFPFSFLFFPLCW